MPYLRRGLRGYDALNPANWGSLISSAWCANTGLCTDAAVKASLAYWNPDVAYPPMAQPPAVKAPAQLITPPASGAEAQQSVNDVLAEQMRAWQAQNQKYFNETGACDPGIDPTCGGTAGIPWGTLAVVALVAVLGISALSGPRRYGR